MKKNYINKLMTRESFQFSRQCELYGDYTRQQAFEILQNVVETDVDESHRKPYRVCLVIQLILSIIPFFLILFYCQTQRKGRRSFENQTGNIYRMVPILQLSFLILSMFCVIPIALMYSAKSRI